MNYILVLGPRLIPTDGMIFSGSEYLFNKVGLYPDEYLQIDDHYAGIELPKHFPSHIIVLGTPWLWDQCWKSHKYANLQSYFNMFPKAKKLFLGIGACFPLGKEDEVYSNIIQNLDKLTVFDNATVIARDVLTANILGSTLLPCPAYYANVTIPRPTLGNSTMFWYDPSIGISSSGWDDMKDEYIEKFREEFRQYDPTVYCVDSKEIKLAQEIGLGTPQRIQDVNHAKLIINNSARVFSGRVHLAVPAYITGYNTQLVAVDSRAKTFEDVTNGTIKGPGQAFPEYIQILKNFVAN